MPLVARDGVLYGGMVATQQQYQQVVEELPAEKWGAAKKPRKAAATLKLQGVNIAPFALYNAVHKCCIVDGALKLVRGACKGCWQGWSARKASGCYCLGKLRQRVLTTEVGLQSVAWLPFGCFVCVVAWFVPLPESLLTLR